MKSKLLSLVMLVTLLALSACSGQPTPAATLPVSLPTQPPQPTANLPTPGQLPTLALPTQPQPTEGATAAATQASQATQVVTGLPGIGADVYLDDRSTPAALMLSFFNAINKSEYLRAYSYYDNATGLGTLAQFTDGYSTTRSVAVVIGEVFSEGAAGSIYSTVPMVLNVITTGGTQQKYAACYLLRFPQPGNYGAPPISPLHIEQGTAKTIPAATSDADALAAACPSPDFTTGPGAVPTSLEPLTDLSSANYIDNRSDAVTVISSLMNAINRKEYVRAYSYWESPTATYAAFAAGYDKTATVTAQFGTVTPDAGAGQIYFALPAALKATLNDGTRQTFVGCYVLHLSQPSVQGTPPFKPLAIKSATMKQVDNNADLTALLKTACQ